MHNNHVRSCLKISAVTALILSLLFLAGFFSSFQNRLHDPLYGANPTPGIVILAVDDPSLQEIGRWPWNRTVFADVINRLDQAVVIGIDINFAEPSNKGDDFLLDSAIKNSSNQFSNVSRVVLPYEYTSFVFDQTSNRIIGKSPLKPIFNTSVGVINLVTDSDGVTRSVRTDIGYPLIFAEEIASRVTITDVPRTDRFLIDFVGPKGSFPTISITDLLNNRINSSFFKNKIVLIGATAPDLHDSYFVPTSKGIAVPGVEIHANIIHTILSKRYPVSEPDLIVILAIFFISLSVAYLLANCHAWRVAFLCLASFIVYLFLAISLFDSQILLDLVFAPLALISSFTANLVYLYRAERKHKRQIFDAFQKYVSPKVIHELLKHPDKLKLGGERKIITIFFSDIRGFTTISEKLSPEKLVELLNEYLTSMTDIIIDSDGVIDKYMGDAIMAFWGAPLDQKDHAVRAANSALTMMAELKKLQKDWDLRGVPKLDIGIGLNTGPAIIGNMGSDKRFDYTCMGDTINLGSRLEGLNKEYGTHIIISEFCKEALQDEFILRELDSVKVKGKKQPITIFELAGKRSDLSKDHIKSLQHFELGLTDYRNQDFEKAIEQFESAIRLSDDKTSQIYVERCKYFLEHPPEKDWDGVWVMKTK